MRVGLGVWLCYQSESVIGRYGVTSQRVLLADTVFPGVLSVRECYLQIQCDLEGYQSESVIGRYSVTSQRGLFEDTVRPGLLPARECY